MSIIYEPGIYKADERYTFGSVVGIGYILQQDKS